MKSNMEKLRDRMRSSKMRSGTALRRHGFTLIELLVVVVIIGILVTIAVPFMMQARIKARETQVATNIYEVHKALQAFGTDNNGNYPFRVRWFDDATIQDPNFDPYTATDTGSGMHSDPGNWFSLGLFGGVRVVTDTFSDNSGKPHDPIPPWTGMWEHKVIQPYGWDFSFYRNFNQYSDPLVAMGYLGSYPENPFLKRPMGNIMWSYGSTGWSGGPDVLDKTIPSPDTLATPGDFVYTFFYKTDGTDISDPEGIVEAKRSYQAKSNTTTHSGMYYLDVIDSYQLWAYGDIQLNGGAYIIYPNNTFNAAVKGKREARKDFDNSGTKDMFEMGMVQYFKSTSTSSLAMDAQGNEVEF